MCHHKKRSPVVYLPDANQREDRLATDMKGIRAFIALDFSPEIYEQLDSIKAQLKTRLSDIPIRWVPTINIHLTLKFLGDVSPTNIEVLNDILRLEAGKFSPFVISVGDLGAFPSIHRPRVIWIGIESPEELKSLHQGIEIETARLGYAPESRPFSPHLTLGRVSKHARSEEVRKIGEVLAKAKVGFLGSTRVSEVHLYRSELLPSGAVYSRLFSASFQG